ncbi:MAG: methyltransferase domain-containing protein, partial [Bacteroidales bacterium]|nr:methyltransferase domain-containing protein [Bacteroidales bacterium]
CRSARWFAPFFSKIFKIETFGYYWYTAFSENKDKYKRATLQSTKVYAAGCPGRKSHGLIGSIKKYSGSLKLEKMIAFTPDQNSGDSTYNKVADLYNQVFQDIKVRKDEWAWIKKHLPSSNEITVLDIGCGNGALLKELSPIIINGLGLDTSSAIIEKAREMNSTNTNLKFQCIDGPKLPAEDRSCDLVISLMSFRYLDWDPLMDEIKRVLKPGGKVLIVDMVTVPPRWYEYPSLLKFKLKHYLQRFATPEFYSNLARLVSDPAWKEMLKHNPIRAEHEMKWYLESRFPRKKTQKINIGMNSCILAFDSGNIENIKEINLSWP